MKRENLTQEMLKELLHYDPETGVFTWKERPLSMFKRSVEHVRFNNNFSGKSAAYYTKKGYYQIVINKITYKAVVIAWFYVYGVWPKSCLDHIDEDRKNLKIKNLREATRTDIQSRRSKVSNKNKTGLLGVVTVKTAYGIRYKAVTQYKRKLHAIGQFKTPEEAHEAYVEYKRQLSPEFCML